MAMLPAVVEIYQAGPNWLDERLHHPQSQAALMVKNCSVMMNLTPKLETFQMSSFIEAALAPWKHFKDDLKMVPTQHQLLGNSPLLWK